MKKIPKSSPDKKLTARQAEFVKQYLIDLNQSEAARRAGYSDARANVAGAELMAMPHVQKAIQEGMRERNARVQITQDRVLQEVARLAFFDIRKLMNDDGSAKPINELDDDTAAAIAGLDLLEEFAGSGEERVQIGWTKKFKITDKKGSLELLMRHMGMLNDKLKLQGDAANPLVLLLQQLSGSAVRPVQNPPEDEDGK
ncbi:terminase small subunit [Caballeronia sp. SEWSISQ10-4 2]|uniref:terminase small subunit n=1 Tax=Caballeronia sp. SEWSISQ10-4 2 TaxID=2937438 RepID=UPI00264D2946|nr:terminase small subunit [Caballeronia sp. SEWSISQ10-4 2]MDN7179079.1 terminase small subunit [Caballeronia sp. SEWSISQ10-4 2]